MKKYYWITILALIVTLVGCKDEKDGSPDPTSEIEGTWNAKGGSVVVDGVDHSAAYSNFSITFTTTASGSKVYTVENGGYAFANITWDTWAFTDHSETKIVRGYDEVEMSYTIDNNVLILEFTIADPLEDGRSKGMFGDFVMTLKK
jgi:uncharacterized lipoprotein NlpE involved in copper resistance